MVVGKNVLVARDSAAEPGERVSRRQYFVANLITAALVLVALGVTPVAKLPLLPIPGYMTAFGTAMIVVNLLLAAFLFCKGAIEDREDAIRLGTAYFFIAAIFVPLTASFPGGLMPKPVIGTEESSIWLWCCWHLGFGLAILRYATLPRSPGSASSGRASSVLGAILAVLAVVVLATLGVTVWLDRLPAIQRPDEVLFFGSAGFLPLSILALLAVSTGAVARLRASTPEQLWLSVGMIAACFDVWLTYCGGEPFSLGWYVAMLGSVFTSLTVLASLFYDLARLYGRLATVNRTLQDLAGRDGLTGLHNRRRLDETLAHEWLRAKRDRQPIALLMIDVDHFKGFNDTYGHQEGDACLRRLAAVLEGATRRPADLVARYGGEEFLICLPGTPAAGAFEVAGQIHAALRALAIPNAASPLHTVTVSIGLAAAVPQEDMTVDALVAAADTGLYRAKFAGRDRAMQAEVQSFGPGDAMAPDIAQVRSA